MGITKSENFSSADNEMARLHDTGVVNDSEKIRVYGPGLQHGVLPDFCSIFVVDTSGAGDGELTVQVKGPKGKKKNKKTFLDDINT